MADDRTLSLGTKFTADSRGLLSGVRLIRKEMDKLNATMGKQAGIMGAGSKADKSLQAAMLSYGKVGAVLGNLSEKSQVWQKAFKQLYTTQGEPKSRARITAMASALDKVHKAVAGQVNSLRAAGESTKGYLTASNLLAQSQKEIARRGKAYNAQLAATNASTKKVYDSTNLFNRQLSRIGSGMERLKAAFKVTAAYGIAATVIFSVVNALKAGIAEIVNYDQALKNLQAITKASDAEVRAMGKAIKDVATRTKYSATEVADAMVILGQAGFSASESIAAIGAVANLATGTLTDMAVAADLLTTIIRAFGKDAFQASEISDIMANAINRSKLTIDKLRIAFNYVGPSADATGTALEEVSAAMMALANSGLRASTIGTGLRQIFARLVAPSSKLREKMEANGIAVEDLNIKVHGFAGVLENLKDIFYDVEKGTMEARLGFELFGLRGANAILSLIKAVESGDYDTYLKYVYEVGTAASMAATQIEGLALKFKNLSDRAKILAVELGENGVGGVIGVLLDSMKGLVSVITELVKNPIGQLLTSLLLIKGGMYAIVTVGALLTSLFKWLVRFMGSKAGALMGGFWGKLAFAVFGTIAAIDQFFKSSKELRAELADERIELMKTADQIDFYQKSLKSAREEMERNSESTYKYEAVIERLKKAFPELADAIEAVKDNAELLDQLLERRKIDDLSEAVNKLIGEYLALDKTVESQKLKSGFVEAIDQEIDAMKRRGEESDKQSRQEHPSTYIAQDWAMKKWEQAGERISNAWEGIKRKFGSATEGLRELGAETEKVKKMTPELALVLEMTSSTLARKYKDQEMSLVEIRKEVRKTLEETKLGWGAIEQVSDQTIEKVQELRRIAQMPFKMGDIDTVFKTIWDNATDAQKDGIRQRQKQLDTEIASYKKFANTHKEIVEDKEAVIANIVLKAHLEMLDLFDDEELAEWAYYAERIEMVKQLAELQIIYIEKIAGEEQKALKDKLERAKGNADREKYIKNKMARLDQQRVDEITAYREQSELMITKFLKEQNRLRNEYEVEQAAKAADRTLAAYDRTQEEAVLLGQKRSERAQVEVTEMELDIATKKFNNLVKLLEEYYIHYELYTTKRLELDAKIKAAEEDMENAKIVLLRASTREHHTLLKKQLKRLEGYYKAGWISAKEYYDKIKEAEEAGLFKDDPKELERLNVLLKGNMWDNFVHGTRRAAQELKTLNDVAMEIGEDFAGVFADNLIDTFEALVDGSKNAKEAFGDFAKDTLNWMTKLIMRGMLMRAVTGMFPSLGMATANVEGGTSSWPTQELHKGGVVGKTPAPIRFVDPYVFANAQRLHRGLAPDEVPAILQKGETVLQKGQGINLQVEVINETGVPVQGEQGETSFDGEKYITNIHLSKLVTNRSYRQAHRRL